MCFKVLFVVKVKLILMTIIIFILIFLFLGSIIFYTYLNESGKHRFIRIIKFLFKVLFVIVFPVIFLRVADVSSNDCCLDTAVFSPEHKLTVYVLISISIISYFIGSYRKEIFSPVLEVLLNSLLIIGLVLDVLILIQITCGEWSGLGFIFCSPIAVLFIRVLNQNHKLLLSYIEESGFEPKSKIGKFACEILISRNKFLYLLILCFPLLFLIASALILFGQKPDSMIRAFTETYRQGFSQLDYMCENVECGGHFLCSVAAKGHHNVVKPERYGERLGKPIICNRQLLVANAFEELIWEKAPRLHNIIRRNYNKVGDCIHKYYYLFNNKYIADTIYILMKPLEYIFIFTLYTLMKNPENIIEMQYLSKKERSEIDRLRD